MTGKVGVSIYRPVPILPELPPVIKKRRSLRCTLGFHKWEEIWESEWGFEAHYRCERCEKLLVLRWNGRDWIVYKLGDMHA